MPPGWSTGTGSSPSPSAASAFTPRGRSRPHRIPVEPDLEREGVRAETGGFLGRFAKVLPHQGTHVAGRPDWLERLCFQCQRYRLTVSRAHGNPQGNLRMKTANAVFADSFCGRCLM